MMRSSLVSLLSLAPLGALAALEANLDDPASIRTAAQQVAQDLIDIYYVGDQPGQIPGILPGPPPGGPYYWWEGGAMWGTLIDYWHWTGDETFNNITFQALQFQAGPNSDYKDKNWTASLGNDDQAFWGMAAMGAAETIFENPPTGDPQWLALAQGVFNDQTSDDLRGGNCSYGLRWQADSLNNGWNYKNTISNGCFMNIGARLGRYTGNQTYIDWVNKTWFWLVGVGYVQESNYTIFDGGYIDDNCTTPNTQQFSYNAGILLQACAFMWNYTSDSVWEDRVNGLVAGIQRDFFKNGVAYEPGCELSATCTSDMLTYKGFIHRWMAYTALLVPSTAATIMPLLKTSTQAAVNQCVGGDNGRQCGFQWASGKFDGLLGAGQQMDVVAALSSLLVLDSSGPVTNTTGGTSQGNPNAGGSGGSNLDLAPITAGDKAGAAIVTIIVLVLATASLWFIYK
ncbi:glycoside hydrolase family 76 protein [Xylariaceae sp. FL0255]|nr:glycoside hydrolase family 76 protein [Xylariaceae sp. FL0255]